MTDDHSLAATLDRLKHATDPHRRGYAFQDFIGELFRVYHFRVVANPKSAYPRQTDLLASRGPETYLIEAKWMHHPATIDDIDTQFTRLDAVDPAVVGVFVSYSGFTDEAIRRVKDKSNRPVLLVTGDEIDRVVRWDGNFLGLLRQKKAALLTDREVLLDAFALRQPRAQVTRRPALPTSRAEFVHPDGTRSRWVACGGSFGQFVFTQRLPDIDWADRSDYGVFLDVPLPARSEDDLLDVLYRLSDLGWASSEACWSFQQSKVNWHGLGAASFAEFLPMWRERGKSPDAHHSEEFCYVDNFDGGFYTLTANIASHDVRQVMYARLSFQMGGIPLDTSPLRELCETFGEHERIYFRSRDERSVVRYWLKPDVPIEPLALIVQADDLEPGRTEFVCGAVIANPYFEARGNEAPDDESFPRMITSSEHLVCALDEWYPIDRSEASQQLVRIEHAWTSEAPVVRAAANWHGRRAKERP